MYYPLHIPMPWFSMVQCGPFGYQRTTSTMRIGSLMTQSYVLGIDQGSSGSRAIVLDSVGAIAGYGYQPVGRVYPQPGWVEQEPQAIAESVRAAIDAAVAQA